jgi:hypothetical protein
MQNPSSYVRHHPIEDIAAHNLKPPPRTLLAAHILLEVQRACPQTVLLEPHCLLLLQASTWSPTQILVAVHSQLAAHPPASGLQRSPACSSWPQRTMWWVGSKILMRMQLQGNSVASTNLWQQHSTRNRPRQHIHAKTAGHPVPTKNPRVLT